MQLDIDEVRRWVTLLHGTSEGLIWVGCIGNMAGRTRSDVEDVISEIISMERSNPQGIYLRTTTLSRVPLDDKGRRGRGTEQDSYTLPGFAADLDIAGPGHKTTNILPPDEAAAMAIVTESGLPEPTIWVHSGGGLYPWWMLEDPQDIREPEALTRAKALSEKIQKILVASGSQLGWHVGGEVGDMARILRVPGTINRKEGLERPCRIIDPPSYEHYQYAELESLVEQLYAALPQPEAPTYTPRVTVPGAGLSPLDDWEAKSDWTDIPGWPFQFVRHTRNETEWLRIGSTSGARLSATTGRAADRDRLYCFTPETVFEARKPYNKQAAYVLLTQGSLSSAAFAQASRDLRSQGFGGELPQLKRAVDVTSLVRPAATPAPVLEQPMDDQEPEQALLPVQADETVSGHVVLPSPGNAIELDLHGEQDAVVTIMHAINAGHIPDLYVRDGQLVHVQRKSSVHNNQVAVSEVCADRLNMLMSYHIRTFKTVLNKDSKSVRKAYAPPISTLRAVTKSNYWPGLPPLAGIIGTPTLRPDGSLIQEPGYDKATGLYLQPTIQVPRVPDSISDEQVRESRDFIFRKVFGEFCWVSPGDFANYMALLVSPMLRPYIKSTTPFGMFSATTPGSGKTNLTDAIGLTYGQSSQVLPSRTEELQKKITSILVGNSSPVVVFDNLKEGTSISSEILATLVTKDTWDDRILGASRNVEAAQDRLWLASGNGLTVGGDMASRTVMVRLDPRTEKPELRNFEMGQFSDWIREDGNREELLYHLLILVQAWRQGGAPKDTTHTMRGFTRWAQVMGGFLAFHGLPGFLGNAGALAELDTDAEEWNAFLAKWHEVFGPVAKTAKELHVSSQVNFVMGTMEDKWSRCFITDEEGHVPNPRSLGRMLSGQEGRIRNGYVLRRRTGREKSALWWVEKVEEGKRE